jgi:hypothetical protein
VRWFGGIYERKPPAPNFLTTLVTDNISRNTPKRANIIIIINLENSLKHGILVHPSNNICINDKRQIIKKYVLGSLQANSACS